jgi:hypothetical protein
MNGNKINDKDNKKFFYHFIETESRIWLIRDCDIRSDGSIPDALLQSSPRARATKIRRFRKEETVF